MLLKYLFKIILGIYTIKVDYKTSTILQQLKYIVLAHTKCNKVDFVQLLFEYIKQEDNLQEQQYRTGFAYFWTF